MKNVLEFLKKYWRIFAVSIISAAVLVILYIAGRYIYKNTYAGQYYDYAVKSAGEQIFDENVTIHKAIKRNGTQGEFDLAFAKKDLKEEYNLVVDKNLNVTNASIEVTGNIKGQINISLLNENGDPVFSRSLKDNPNIKESVASQSFSKKYTLIIEPVNAQNGNIKIKYKFS